MQKRIKFSSIFLLALALSAILNFGCTSRLVKQLSDPSVMSRFGSNRKNIKIHMKDGSLYVLDSLITYVSSDTMQGYGSYYNQYRDRISVNVGESGLIINPPFIIELPDVALLETNKVTGLKGKSIGMALVAVPSSVLAIYCMINPKACFGSCPTFYSWDGTDTTLMAEGFSSSILKTFEKTDVDMLYWAKPLENDFHIRLKNEALETHIIRYVNLLAIPRNGNERVFATEDGEFFAINNIQSPVTCNAPEGNCLETVKMMDHLERFSASDPKDLANREFIEMSFNNIPEGQTGLIIGCRQTLLTTYLFYQSLAYLGNSAGYFAARIESGDKSLERKVDRMWELLGGIEVFIRNSDNRWEKVNQVGEMGPLATDVHLIKLPVNGKRNIDVRLKLTKGLWRIDYLALGQVVRKVEPVRIEPYGVKATSGTIDNGVALLKDTPDPLITLPGDTYDISFFIPGRASDYELFLNSRGYYIEWMRETWLMEENLRKAAILFGFPGLYLKMAADDFKMLEPSMEETFWKSKYVKKN